MSDPHPPQRDTPPPDADGVRVQERAGPRRRIGVGVVVALVLVVGVGTFLARPGGDGGPGGNAPPAIGVDAADARDALARSDAPSAAPRGGRGTARAPIDPNDLASYAVPGTPEPTMAEVIQRLHAAGIRTGLGAFNPPGTSPPLTGLAVPEDFPLPEGYVRHYQATDDGQRIEPILMYSPDFEFLDANGHPIPIPEDRVVPPHLAPPGLPLRMVRIPPPQTNGGRS